MLGRAMEEAQTVFEDVEILGEKEIPEALESRDKKKGNEDVRQLRQEEASDACRELTSYEAKSLRFVQ